VGRVRAARALSRDRHPAASQALRQSLVEQPFWGLRAEICSLLGRLDADRAALVNALRQDPHPRVRKAAASALGAWTADSVVIEALEALLDAGQEPALHVEGECLKSLGRLRAPSALARLESAARRSSWADLLRARALEGLGATREPAALPLLVGYTTEAWGARTRTAAASALGRLAEEVESLRTPAVETLIGLCRAAPFRTRLAAASALGKVGDPRGIAILDELHACDRDGRTQRIAWEAARRIRKGRSSEASLAGLREELEKVQAEARKLREGLTRLEQTAR
jgi:aminopeptidase N